MREAVMHWLVNGSSVDAGIISVGDDQITAAPRARPTMENRLHFPTSFSRTVLLRVSFLLANAI